MCSAFCNLYFPISYCHSEMTGAGQKLRAFVAFAKDQGSMPTTAGSKPSITPIPRRSNTLFWPPQARDTHVVHSHTCRKSTRTLRINLKKIAKCSFSSLFVSRQPFLPSVLSHDPICEGWDPSIHPRDSILYSKGSMALNSSSSDYISIKTLPPGDPRLGNQDRCLEFGLNHSCLIK